jgi:putative transposase
MGKPRRKFSSELKTRLVLEVLREEEELSVIAARHNINPNQLRRWKAEFLENAASVFDDKQASRKRIKEIEAVEAREAEMLKKIGELTIERDYLQRVAKEYKERGCLRGL